MSSQPKQIQQAQVIPFPVPTLDSQLESKLARFWELKALAAEYEKLKKELKPAFEGSEEIQIGKFTVTGRYITQPEKTVPSFTYWDMRVKAQ